jgi:RNA polymerase-binding transcription factor DksA
VTEDADHAAARSVRALRRERQRAINQLAARQEEYDAVAAGAAAEGRDDEHDPDGSTPAGEYALAFGLRAAALAHLDEVDRALERLAAGTYGRCQVCGVLIAPERLEALPTAVACVGCAGK